MISIIFLAFLNILVAVYIYVKAEKMKKNIFIAENKIKSITKENQERVDDVFTLRKQLEDLKTSIDKENKNKIKLKINEKIDIESYIDTDDVYIFMENLKSNNYNVKKIENKMGVSNNVVDEYCIENHDQYRIIFLNQDVQTSNNILEVLHHYNGAFAFESHRPGFLFDYAQGFAVIEKSGLINKSIKKCKIFFKEPPPRFGKHTNIIINSQVDRALYLDFMSTHYSYSAELISHIHPYIKVKKEFELEKALIVEMSENMNDYFWVPLIGSLRQKIGSEAFTRSGNRTASEILDVPRWASFPKNALSQLNLPMESLTIEIIENIIKEYGKKGEIVL